MAGVRVVEAVVQVDGVETPYRRAGRGRTVLLLASGLFEPLAAAHRVVEPLRAPAEVGGRGWEVWLRGLIDGLGLDRVAVVADAAVIPALRELGRLDPERIEVVVEAGSGPAVLARLRTAHERIDH